MHHNMFGIKWKQIKYPKWWAQYHYSCFFFDENKFLRNRVSFILGRTVSYVNDASWKKIRRDRHIDLRMEWERIDLQMEYENKLDEN